MRAKTSGCTLSDSDGWRESEFCGYLVLHHTVLARMRHRLDLFDNAADSLNEGLRKYREAQEGSTRAFKFAVLHFAHFAELFFKHCVASGHPLLIYKNPSSRNLANENTVGLSDAVQILRNAGTNVDPELYEDLAWLKKLRNQIEHHRFDLDVREVRDALGRIIRATEGFALASGLASLRKAVEPECGGIYDTLLDEYRHKLADARSDAKAAGTPETICHCSACGEAGVAVEGPDHVECFFCDEKEPLHRCVICDQVYRDSEMSIWNDEHPPGVDYICTYCEDDMLSDQ